MLVFDRVCKSYGQEIALDGFTLRVAPGRVVALVGPNGAGKTTAMRAAFGYVTVDSGEVTWCGNPISHTVRREFGFVPQEPALYPEMRNVRQLTYLGRLAGESKRAARDGAKRALEEFGLQERATAKLSELSGGDQQKVKFGAGLMCSSKLVVADEPFTYLDPDAVDQVVSKLRAMANRGAAVLVSSHQVEQLELFCDEIAVIRDGRVLAAGEVHALKETHPFRYVTTTRPHADTLIRDFGGEPLSVGSDHFLRVPASVPLATIADLVSEYRRPTLRDIYTSVGA